MPYKLKRLSGAEVVSIFTALGFHVHSQRGSHVKLRRISASGDKQTLTIPNHKEIDIGTSRAIYRQACKYISENELRGYFYTE